MRSPVTLISNAVGRVFLSELASAKKKQNVEDLTREHLNILGKTGIPLVIVLGLIGSAMASRIFGSDYADISYYMLCMIPWMAAVMLTTPFTAALYSYERFQLALFLACLGAILRVGGVFLSFVLDLDPILILSASNIATYLLYLLSISQTIGIGLQGWFHPLLAAVPRMITASAIGILVLIIEGTIL